MNPFVHATDLVRLLDCKRLAWLNHEHVLPAVTYANNTESFKNLTDEYLNMSKAPNGQVGDSVEDSTKILQEYGYGRHLRLEAESVRTSIPVLAAIGTLYQFGPIFQALQKEYASFYGYALLDYKPDKSRKAPADIQTESEDVSAPMQKMPLENIRCEQDEKDSIVCRDQTACSSFQMSALGDNKQRTDQKTPWYQRSYAALYPHLSKTPGAHDLPLVSLNQQIAKACGIDIVHHQVLGLNPDYVKEQNLDLNALFFVSAHPYKRPGSEALKSMDILLQKEKANLFQLAREARSVLYAELPEPEKCRACLAPRHCAMQEECFGTDSLDDASPAFLFSSRQKKKITSAHIESMEEITPEMMDGFSLQYAQIQAAKNGGTYMDKQAIRRWIDKLVWPLIYLDFEWDTFAIPPYAKMHPFDVLCFQYSMHVEQKDGSLSHDSFFSGGDGREAFIRQLLERIPKQGSILVYNMEGAEKLRLLQLARQFPQYAKELEALCERMVDLSSLFEYGSYYDLAQRGRFSLKSVLPLFDKEDSYNTLAVKDGLDAIQAYRRHEASTDPKKQEEIARNISDYCAMDTMAEVIILHGLMEKTA